MSRLVPIFFMGKEYPVPEGLTILGALEYAGYRVIRGCGCRGGFCGACATVYRLPGESQIKVGLACQTRVEPGMVLAMLPYYPAPGPAGGLNGVADPAAALHRFYPALFRCLGCGACTKICPQDLPVMDIVALLQRGDLAAAAGLSFDCIACGLCASRCLAQMAPYQIAMTARRLYGRFFLPRPDYVTARIGEVAAGEHDRDLDRLAGMDPAELQELYAARDIESI